jgi:hypothetical protein
MTEPDPALSPVDLRLRVIALALEPGLTLARLGGLPLDDLQAMVASGYFRQWKARGLSLRGIARRMHKSLRTVATLASKAGADGTSTPLSKRIGWRRKLVARVAERGAIDRRKLAATIRGEARGDVDIEIEQLLEEGVLSRSQDAITVAVQYLNMVDDHVEARLDSLRHFLDAVTNTIFQRFLADEASTIALARVLSFSADPDQLVALRDQVYASLRERVIAADAQASPCARAASVAFAISETPARLSSTSSQ